MVPDQRTTSTTSSLQGRLDNTETERVALVNFSKWPQMALRCTYRRADIPHAVAMKRYPADPTTGCRHKRSSRTIRCTISCPDVTWLMKIGIAWRGNALPKHVATWFDFGWHIGPRENIQPKFFYLFPVISQFVCNRRARSCWKIANAEKTTNTAPCNCPFLWKSTDIDRKVNKNWLTQQVQIDCRY